MRVHPSVAAAMWQRQGAGQSHEDAGNQRSSASFCPHDSANESSSRPAPSAGRRRTDELDHPITDQRLVLAREVEPGRSNEASFRDAEVDVVSFGRRQRRPDLMPAGDVRPQPQAERRGVRARPQSGIARLRAASPSGRGGCRDHRRFHRRRYGTEVVVKLVRLEDVFVGLLLRRVFPGDVLVGHIRIGS